MLPECWAPEREVSMAMSPAGALQHAERCKRPAHGSRSEDISTPDSGMRICANCELPFLL
jgi:hypothetical protein